MGLRKLFSWLTKPKSKDKDLAGREFILNVLLLGSVLLFWAAAILVKLQGFPVEITTAISLTFLALYFFSRAGKSRLVTYIFVWLCFISATYISYRWGADVPQALLIYALAIVMAGVLIGARLALAITIFSSVVLFTFAYLQIEGIILINGTWTGDSLNFGGVVIHAATLGIVAIVF